MAPGDTFLTNDPFEGGTMLRFRRHPAGVLRRKRGRLRHRGRASARCRRRAVRAALPPDALGVQEGLRLSGSPDPRRPADRGLRAHHRRERAPAATHARRHQRRAGAVRIAERRLGETIARYGLAAVAATFAWSLDAARRRHAPSWRCCRTATMPPAT